MYKELSLNEFIDEFKDYNRNYYSYEGYKTLYDFYNELEGFELDVVAICCDVTEYGEEDLIENYGYLYSYEYFLTDNEGLYDDDADEEKQTEYIKALADEIQNHTTILFLDNGSYLVWDF